MTGCDLGGAVQSGGSGVGGVIRIPGEKKMFHLRSWIGTETGLADVGGLGDVLRQGRGLI